jgi:ligand-binding sensor domain-containing protein
VIQPLVRLGLLVPLAVCWAAPAAGQVRAPVGSRAWLPEERVLITDMSVVAALAANENVLYVVTSSGIGVYDIRFRRWLPPVTVLDGYAPTRPFAALVDPTDESLWLGTALGVVNYSPRMRWYQTTTLAGGADRLMLDREDAFAGVYLHNASGWQFLPRGGMLTRPVTSLPPAGQRIGSASLREIVARHPEIETLRAGTLLDSRMRSFRYTAAAEVPIADLVFLGTNGLGVVRYDGGTGRLERLPFGLLAPGASALVRGPDGVWVGSDGHQGRSGVTLVSRDLQRFRFEEGPRVTGLGGAAVHDLVVHDGRLWLATDVGVVILDSGEARRLTSAQGLPTGAALALAAGGTGVWVGTERGLAFIADDGTITRVGAQLVDRVNALAVAGDALWVGSRAGLGLSVAGSQGVFVPPAAEQVPELRDAIVDVAVSAAFLVAAVRDGIAWRSLSDSTGPEDGGWLVEHAVAALGAITAVECDADLIWLGGTRGFAHYTPATRAFAFYTSGDVPGVVRDIVVDERYVWVATEGGVVRIDKRAIL